MSEPQTPAAEAPPDAAVSTLDRLFRPRSVAVIGASRERHTIGWDILHNLLTYEFQGEVFPVNPRATVVHSLKCYADVEAIPDAVDLAVVSVPKPLVRGVVEACGRKGIGGLVIVTAGFKEVGEAGAADERAIRDIARAHGMRMIGPNCMGIINTDPAVRLQASFAATEPLEGNIAFSSQSGALGEAVLAAMRDMGLGLSMFVSLGNKADVSGNDLLEYWERDPRTRAILMYLESFGNPRRFVTLARRVTQTKPVLVVKSGRTAAGARAAASHTGSLAGADTAVDSLLAQCGVIRAASIHELFVCAAAFSTQPVPRGKRIAIVTNSGGPAILATDACVQLGLEIPALDPATQQAMRRVLAPEASVVNPVDMIATATGEKYEICLRAVAADPHVDAIIAIFTSLEMIDGLKVAEGIAQGLAGQDKPAAVCFMGKLASREGIERLKTAGLPVYTFPEDAAMALHALVRYRLWRERPAGTVPVFTDVDRDAVRRTFAEARQQGRLQLTLAEASRVIEAAGIAMAPWREAATPDAAAAAAGELGYPVALKISSAVLVHKSDVGGVRLNLGDREAVARAAGELLARARGQDAAATLVVQRMTAGVTEVIFGSAADPQFGPLMMFGLGGVFVEVLKDVVFRVHPISDVDADDMIAAIKGYPLLTGARGLQPVNLAAIKETLLRLNQLLADFPEIQELDINPFFAAAAGAPSLAADARLQLAR
ncbi:MAG TPA: acetate--CoA ligase family protein [Vicinamibacterales bacterium]|nr:acetate--CoA ligase family protein [Vicinamibacterales bacterium]